MSPQGYSSGIADQLYRNYDNNNPQTSEEWTEKHIELVKRKKEIEVKLGDKNMLADDGGRLSGKAYFQRRQRLLEEKNEIEQQLLDLKALKRKLFSMARGIIKKETATDKEKEILQGGDSHAIVLTLLKDIATSLKHIQFLLHREWTEDE